MVSFQNRRARRWARAGWRAGWPRLAPLLRLFCCRGRLATGDLGFGSFSLLLLAGDFAAAPTIGRDLGLGAAITALALFASFEAFATAAHASSATAESAASSAWSVTTETATTSRTHSALIIAGFSTSFLKFLLATEVLLSGLIVYVLGDQEQSGSVMRNQIPGN